MMWKVCTILHGLAVAAFTLPALALQPRVNGEVSIVTETPWKTWSSIELRQLSMGSNMAAVISSMAGTEEDEWGVARMSRKRIQERMGEMAVSDLRAIVLDGAKSGKARRTNKLADFAGTEDPMGTCAAVASAGWGGIDTCAEKCINKRYVQRIAAHEGACLVLCALAADPCTEKNSSWTSGAKKWTQQTKALLARVAPATVEAVAGITSLLLTQLSNDDTESFLLLLLGLLLAIQVAIDYPYLRALRSRGRRAESDLASSHQITNSIKQSRVFRPRPRRKAAGGECSLLNEKNVVWSEYRAKIAATRRREACDKLAAGFTFAAKKAKKAKVASSFARWKGEAKAPAMSDRQNGTG